jgi:choline dehydrogenase-like flavoprotein
MGKVLGGGSSVNVMVWARGHKSDWDFFASEAGDPAWSYESVLNIYRRMEDWHGAPDPKYRGAGGPVFVQPAPNPNPIALPRLKEHVQGTSKNRRFPPPRKSDSKFSYSERERLGWDSFWLLRFEPSAMKVSPKSTIRWQRLRR